MAYDMQIFTVSEFITVLNDIMRRAISPHEVGILGEVAEYKVSQDKWIWFKLKDEQGIIDCFATVWQLRQPLENGMKINAYGYPKIHQKSGKFSINVERVELVGEGALRRAFELLKKKLAAEGLFAPERKRTLPRFPEHIGLIASRESAAYTDFIRILNNRWSGVTVHLCHVSVQGASAIKEIVEAFDFFNKLRTKNHELRTLVLIRGGGSIEDLHAFNSEEVARAIFASQIPVLVGVGHERDETIADYVADRRASTPSNAAEILAPDRREVGYTISVMAERLRDRMDYAVESEKDRLADITTALARFIERKIERVYEAARIIAERFTGVFERVRERMDTQTRMLDNLNPQKLLARGYSVVFKEGHVVRSAKTLSVNDILHVRLAEGEFESNVRRIKS